MDLLLIKMEKVDENFYKSLLQFISESGYKSQIVTYSTDELVYKELAIIPSKRQVLLHQKEVILTAKEFDILELLARNKGRVFSKDEIYDRIWGESYVLDNRNIIAYINKIRKKIEPDPSNPIYILTVWGVGYKFNDQIEGAVVYEMYNRCLFYK